MIVQKTLNGININIDFPVEDIISQIEARRDGWMESLTDVINGYDESSTEKMRKEEIDTMIKRVLYYKEHTDELFDELPLKKNNKLSKGSKPILYCLGVGSYWEDSYGWHTYEVKMKAMDELNAVVYLDDTIVHY